MIRNEKELAVELEALGCVERALESLRQKLMPHNPTNFAIYSEGYVEQIEKLKAEIDEYLARTRSGSREANIAVPPPAPHSVPAS